MVKPLLIALIILIIVFPANSQILNNKGGQVLLKGIVRDELTGSPVSVNLEFKSQSGSKIKVTSNSVSGVYEQILKAGESYEVLLSNYDIIRKTAQVQIINADQYQEQSQNFTITRLTPGLQLYKVSAFGKSSHKISDETKKIFDDLQELMKFNRNVKFEVIISGDYQQAKQSSTSSSNKKGKATSSSKSKKAKKDAATQSQAALQTKQASDKVHALVDSRISEVQSLLDSWVRAKERITFKPDYDFKTPNSTSYNLIIAVTSVEEIFK